MILSAADTGPVVVVDVVDMLRVTCGSLFGIVDRSELKIARVTAKTAISAARLLKLYVAVVVSDEAVVVFSDIGSGLGQQRAGSYIHCA